MAAQSSDIFESDSLFIEFASSVLLGIGLVMLPLGVSCKIIDWGFCDLQIVPLFAGQSQFRADLSSINLPLAMIILGFAARLYTRFGWTICVLLLGLLTTFFSFMVYYLKLRLDKLYDESPLADSAVGQFSFIESMILNGGFALLCLIAIIYMFLPGVLKLYWRRNQGHNEEFL